MAGCVQSQRVTKKWLFVLMYKNTQKGAW